jgi:hypothetical protein
MNSQIYRGKLPYLSAIPWIEKKKKKDKSTKVML